MPQPIGADWNLVQTLYLQGKTPKEIEAITGVKANLVSVRATRKGWTRAMTAAKPIMQLAVEVSKEKPESSIGKHSEAVRTGLADLLARSVEKIQEIALKTPKHALAVSQELESLVRNAKTVFGWPEGQSQPSVRINVLSSFSVAPASSPVQDQQPVIDVTSTPVPLPAPPAD